jgi:hypothetical protein
MVPATNGSTVMSDEDDVRRLALALPDTRQHPEGFSFSVGDKAFAWSFMERVAPRKPRVRRPDILAVRVAGEVDKQSLIDADPDVYFTDDHYRGYPAVLVRLPAIEPDELRELLTDAWRTQAPRRLVRALDDPPGTVD